MKILRNRNFCSAFRNPSLKKLPPLTVNGRLITIKPIKLHINLRPRPNCSTPSYRNQSFCEEALCRINCCCAYAFSQQTWLSTFRRLPRIINNETNCYFSNFVFILRKAYSLLHNSNFSTPQISATQSNFIIYSFSLCLMFVWMLPC